MKENLNKNLSEDYVRLTPKTSTEKAMEFYESGDLHFKKFWIASGVFYAITLGFPPTFGAIFLAEAGRQAILGIKDYVDAHRVDEVKHIKKE